MLAPPASDLDALTFDNRFTRELPADPEPGNFTRQVAGACYSRVRPTPVAAPRLLAYSREVAETLGLSAAAVGSDEFAEVFGGNRLLSGMDPFAMCYGGHQFGNWAGQLGDGRAINLGEVAAADGHWALQLKGAGPTPYSRRADGRAVLRSSVREFLCSEAMHHLGVPTTRALCLVGTGEPVVRDMFYDGHPKAEPGAVVCRVARSFLRLGNFELLASRGDETTLRALADFTLRHHFPHLLEATGKPCPEAYAAWFTEVCRTTADMIVHWMRVGFVHGVMNTDNLSILGVTIDYGPYGWLEDFDPDWTPNTTDAAGRRYAFGRQPQIALWNLARFAESLLPLVGAVEPLERGLETYWDRWDRGWETMLAAKLGLTAFDPTTDAAVATDLLAVLQLAETDMTIFYRRLAEVRTEGDEPSDETLLAPLADAYYVPEQLTPEVRSRTAEWVRRYRSRVRKDGTPDAARRQRMNAVNPKYVLRNYLAQLAIDKAEAGDPSLISELLDVLRRPYDEQPENEDFAAKRPDWARSRAGCSMLSCSS